jgi:ribonuclease HI
VPLLIRWKCINTRILATQRYTGRAYTVYREVQHSHAARLAWAANKERNTMTWLRGFPVPKKAWLPDRPFWQLGLGLQAGLPFPCPGKKASWSERQVTQAALDIVAHHRNHQRVECYTDGSKKDGEVGAAFWFPAFQKVGGCSLAPWSSILTAELRAIFMAITWVVDTKVEGDVVILTDSQAAIQALLQPRPVQQTRTDCWGIRGLGADRHEQSNAQVYLQWIPSHRGIPGNEYVDAQAGLARSWVRGKGQVAARGEIKTEIRKYSIQHWQTEWDKDPHGRFRHEVCPELRATRINWKRRDNDVFFTRMRMGVVKTADWRKKILKEGSGLCNRGCNEVEDSADEEAERPGTRDTLRHILLECGALTEARSKGARALTELDLSWTLPHMFSCKTAFYVVLAFLRDAGLLNRLMR